VFDYEQAGISQYLEFQRFRKQKFLLDMSQGRINEKSLSNVPYEVLDNIVKFLVHKPKQKTLDGEVEELNKKKEEIKSEEIHKCIERSKSEDLAAEAIARDKVKSKKKNKKKQGKRSQSTNDLDKNQVPEIDFDQDEAPDDYEEYDIMSAEGHIRALVKDFEMPRKKAEWVLREVDGKYPLALNLILNEIRDTTMCFGGLISHEDAFNMIKEAEWNPTKLRELRKKRWYEEKRKGNVPSHVDLNQLKRYGYDARKVFI
jgi:hypothetical protein